MITCAVVMLFSLFLLTHQDMAVAESNGPPFQWEVQRDIDLGDMGLTPDIAESSHDGGMVALFDQKLVVVNTTSRSQVIEWTPPSGIQPTWIEWSNNDAMVAIASGTSIKVVSTENGELVRNVQVGEYVEYLEFNRDDRLLGASSDSRVYVYDTDGWTLQKQLTIPDRTVFDFTWSPVQEHILVFTNFGITGYNASDWTPLEDFTNDPVGHSGAWVDDHSMVYPTESNMVVEFDTVNDTMRLIARDQFTFDYTFTLYDRDADDVLLYEFFFPKVLDRETGERVQYLLYKFPSRRDFIDASLPDSGLELYVLWTDSTDRYHLSVLAKEEVVRPVEGSNNPRTVFAMLEEYRFRYDLPSTLNDYSITQFRLEFGNSTDITWDQDGTVSVANDRVVCSYALMRSIPETYLSLGVWFNWTYPHDASPDITLSVKTSDGIWFEWAYGDALTVVTNLGFLGGPSVEGEHQGRIGNGSWVRAGEGLEWSLPRIVYVGYGQFPSPPDSEIHLFLLRDARVEWHGSPADNASTRTTVRAPDVPHATCIYEVEGVLVMDNHTIDTYRMTLLVDGSPPVFLGHLPQPGIWQSTPDVIAGVWMTDGEGCGLDTGSLSISWRIITDGRWSEWTPATLEELVNGTIFGRENLRLQEGTANQVMWSCSDRVGNVNETDSLEIWVDLSHVSFRDFKPDRWVNTTDVLCSVVVSDTNGSGVSGPSIQMRWSTHGVARYGSWVTLDLSGSRQEWTVERLIPLEEGASNLVQWRAEDVAGSGLTDSDHYLVRVDTTPPVLNGFSPTTIQTTHEFEVRIDVSDLGGSGVAVTDVEWRMDGKGWNEMAYLQAGIATTTVNVDQDGRYNVTFRAHDGAGNPSLSSSYVVSIDTTPPAFASVDPPSGRYIIGTSCRVTVHVVDDIAGVNASSLQYSERRGTGTDWGPWHSVPDTSGAENGVTGLVLLDLDPDHDNWIRFWATDIAGNGPAETVSIHLPVDMPPVARISSPIVDDTYYDNMKIVFDSNGSGDEEGPFTVTWTIDGDPLGTDPIFKTVLTAGSHTIGLRVTDEAGQTSETGMTIHVQTADVETGTFGIWLLAVVLVVAVVSVLLMLRLKYPGR
jgi:hypothetical protein